MLKLCGCTCTFGTEHFGMIASSRPTTSMRMFPGGTTATTASVAMIATEETSPSTSPSFLSGVARRISGKETEMRSKMRSPGEMGVLTLQSKNGTMRVGNSVSRASRVPALMAWILLSRSSRSSVSRRLATAGRVRTTVSSRPRRTLPMTI